MNVLFCEGGPLAGADTDFFKVRHKNFVQCYSAKIYVN